MWDTIITTPIVSSPVATTNENQELVLQKPIETIGILGRAVTIPFGRCAKSGGSRKSQRVRTSAIPDDYKVYISEEIQMVVIPPHLKKP